MRRVVLLNMPFAPLRFPSLALSQLASLVQSEFRSDIALEVVYANHDLGGFIGVDLLEELTENYEHHPTGIGEWLFRQVAFPHVSPNEDQYFRRFYPRAKDAAFRQRILTARDVLGDFCSQVAKENDLASADVVGFTSMFAQTVPSLAMARIVKALNPRTVTIMGGANCEAPMGAAILRTTTDLDFVFSGPALRTFPLFLRQLLDGHVGECDTFAGIVSARTSSIPQRRHAVGAARPIDDVVEPDFTAFVGAFERTYAGTDVKPVLFFETSRGCWWGERSHCTFCGLNGLSMAYSAMKPELAVEQFERLFGHHPWCSEYFCVDNVMPANYPADVFPRVTAPPGATVFYEVKVNASREDLSAMAAAGVTVIQPGIEALATRTLKLMRKGTTSFQNIRFLKECLALGITPLWNLLIGFPGEDESVYEKYSRDLPLLLHLPPPVGVFSVRFDRYSPYFTDAEAFGLDLRPFPFYGLTFPGEDGDLSDLAYYFVDRRDAAYKRAATRWWPVLRRLVKDWQSRWSDGDRRPMLRICGADGRGEIVDSRGEAAQGHSLDERALFLLQRLQTPTRVAQLVRATDGLLEDVEEALAYLRECKLLFEEGGRALSLVDIPGGLHGDPLSRSLRRESQSRKLVRT